VTNSFTEGWGMIHGRFQPFHRGHLAYLTAAAGRCERLLVGITNPDRLHTRAEPEDGVRHLPEANPFTYTERLLMVRAAAAAAGVAPVEVIPFPISDPEVWPDYVPAGTVHFLRVLSPWGAAKLERLRAEGFEVVVLDAGGGKEISGEQVRAAIRGGADWEPLVPAAVAALIRSLPPRRALAPHPAP
jgi:cytidyltransferase-like protein